MTDEPIEDGWEWARVEIFGHTKHYGRVREEDKLGAKMLRIDIPIFQAIRGIGDVSPKPLRWETCWYSQPAIFSLTLTDEEAVMKANKPYESPYRARLPAYETVADHDVEEIIEQDIEELERAEARADPRQTDLEL